MSISSSTRVGLLTDLHYDGGLAATNRLYAAVEALNIGGADLLVVMGDLVNGDDPDHAKRLLREVASICSVFGGEVRYMPGNHDLDHLSKRQFLVSVGAAAESARFYFERGGYAFVGLDGNHRPDGAEYDRGNFDWAVSHLPDEQLEWLRETLAATTNPAILFCHQRLDQDSKFAVRNHRAARDVIARAENVVAVFQGHNHQQESERIDGTLYQALGAHVDGAGPALLRLDAQDVSLTLEYQPEKETAS